MHTMGRTGGLFENSYQLSWKKSLSVLLLLCTFAKGHDAVLEGGRLFVADSATIQVASFSDFDVSALDFTTLPFSSVSRPIAIDFDPITGTVFWSENGYIKRGDLDGSNQLILNSDVQIPDGLALDVFDQRVYWTDTGLDEISSMSYDGTSRQTIINSELDQPRAIVIHQRLRVMFWTDWGDQPKIERADLSGSNRMTIVETGLVWPNGLSLNSEGTLLYWIDASLDLIEVVDLCGDNRRTILSLDPELHPFDLVVFGTNIVWTNWFRFSGIGYTTTNGESSGTLHKLYNDKFASPMGIHVHVSGTARVENLQLSPSSSHIEVNWTVASTKGYPDYYIIRYSLYQKLACPSPETNLTEVEVITNSTGHVLVGLEPYSLYNVSVMAANSAGQSEAATGYTNTSQGRPSNITDIQADLEKASFESISFTWQPLTCSEVNGDFWYYYARIYKDGRRDARPAGATYLDDEFSYSSVEFEGLEPCTMYELNIHAVNRLAPPGHVFNSIGETAGQFTQASATDDTETSPTLLVSWSILSKCNVDYYRLSYQLISRKACPGVLVVDAPIYELNITSRSTNVSQRITDLEHYAAYNISIVAGIKGAETSPELVIGDTSDGVPTAIQSVSHKSRAETLFFTWEEPSCEELHGLFFGYEYDLYNIAEQVTELFMSIEGNGLQVNGLDADTEYRFRVRVATTNRRSEWHVITASTDTSGTD